MTTEAFNYDESVRMLPDKAIDALALMIDQLPSGATHQGDVAKGEMGFVFMVGSLRGNSVTVDSVVTKIFRDGDSAAAFESMIIAKVSSGEAPPPLAVPKLLAYDPKFPGHLIMSKVPGVTLPNETVRAFSPAEKRLLGSKIGEFVAWLQPLSNLGSIATSRMSQAAA